MRTFINSSERTYIMDKFVYTLWERFVLNRVREAPNQRFTFKELFREYEEKGNKRISHSIAYRQLKGLPGLSIERKEQLWIFYDTTTDGKGFNSMYGYDGQVQTYDTGSNLVHSSHRWRFTVPYSGTQPLEKADQVRAFGRYRTAKQSYYLFKDMSIVAHRKKLNCWIHRPKGALTPNQRIEALTRARLSLNAFCTSHNLKLIGNVEEIMNSHHVVEAKPLNEALKPVFAGREEEIKEVVGSHICKSSHPGKIEHEGREGLNAYGVAKNLEYLCTDFPSDFSTLARENVAFRENLQTHLSVMREISSTLKEMRTLIKQIGDRY